MGPGRAVDEARQELRGERTGMRYAVGSRVRVQVSRVDLDGRKIDFRMVREGETDQLLQRGRKPATATQALKEVQAKDRAAKSARAKAVTKRSAVAGKVTRAGKTARAHKGR